MAGQAGSGWPLQTTFEKQFYESNFLQALYKASCPKYQNIPFIVVLDEMNLSHPEQYFADLLSALEQEPEQQHLSLMTASVASAPECMADGGKKLPLPLECLVCWNGESR